MASHNINIDAIAHQFLGTPYVWGGTNPRVGLDCSGFLQLVYKKAGINIPRTTYDQYKTGRPVSLNQLQPGDAVFIEPSAQGPGHVGMYIGHGMVQQSPHTGTVNSIMPLKSFVAGGFVGARRYLPNGAGQMFNGPIPGPALGYSNHGPVDVAPTILGLAQSVLARNAARPQMQQPQVAAPIQYSLGGS